MENVKREDVRPVVSVIIPTIGRETLKNTLESVINQTYSNLEIIVTDDTENGKAYRIIESYLKTYKERLRRYFGTFLKRIISRLPL